MLAVYDLSCNGLREPHGVVGNPRFSWRLGSDRAGASQAAYRINVTSMGTGDVVWDSGKVRSDRAQTRYAGAPLVTSDQYVWFVAVWDDAGEQAYGTPSAFLCGDKGEEPWGEWLPQRRGMVWTSDERLNQAVEEASQYQRLVGTLAMRYVWDVGDDESAQCERSNKSSRTVEHAWRNVVGLVEHSADFATARIQPPSKSELPCELQFAQGSLLIPQGLLFVRWEQDHDARRLQVSMPPGVSGTLVLGTKQVEVVSGQHVLCEGKQERQR